MESGIPFEFTGQIALVTGASRGIGAEIVRELARRRIGGLVLVARAEDELNALANELRTQLGFPANAPLFVVPADLSDPDAPARIKAETDKQGLTIDLLVNNAGFGANGFFHESRLDRQQDMVQVNITALMALTRLYLPEMVARNRGAVLNVGSTAAFQAVPYMTTYAATKAFVQSFSEGLWAEMKEAQSEVRILCLCPGGTTTHFGDRLEHPTQFNTMPHHTAEQVAKVGLDGLDRDRPYVVVGAMNNALTILSRFASRSWTAQLSGSLFRPLKDDENPSSPKRLSDAAFKMGAGVAILAVLFGVSRITRQSSRMR